MAGRVRSARVVVRNKATGARAMIDGGQVVAVQHGTKAHGSYDAASSSRRSKSWGGVNGGPNVVLGSSDTLRRRLRDGVRNIGMMDAAVSTIEANVVGTGIRPQFTTPDKGLNRDLEQLWAIWADECDPSGLLNFYGQQALTVRSTVEGGDAFGRLRMRRPNDGLAVPLQIQLLEAEHCPSTMNQAYGGNHIVGGVEITPFGARAAYWFHPEHPEDQFTRWSVGTGERRVPANQVFHTMQMRRIGQLRGEPWLTRAYIIAAELHGYRDAESVRKKIAALLVGWRKRPVPDHLDAEELEKLWSAADEEEDGILHGDVKPGTILDLDFGEDMGFNTPADVGGNFEAYVVDTNRAFAAAAGTLYEHITGDYGKLNDRTLRAAVNEFRRRAAMWQHQMVAFQMCRPVHRAWIQAATLSRAIRAPAGMTDAQLMMVKWVPQAWPYIHPVQDIEADTAAVRAGFTSRQAVVAKRGRDASEVDEEQQADNQRADDRRISYDSDARRASNDPTKQRTEERTDAE